MNSASRTSTLYQRNRSLMLASTAPVRRLALVVSAAAALASGLATPSFAGGAGGAGNSAIGGQGAGGSGITANTGGQGGGPVTGGSSSTNGAGTAGSDNNFEGGGGGGGAGITFGRGGNGSVAGGTSTGANGNSISRATSAGGGGGAGGQHGYVFPTLSTDGSVSGGNGGNGGNATSTDGYTASGGGGGAGGYGAIVTGILSSGLASDAISGGNGGKGGDASGFTSPRGGGGGGGGGGDGIVFNAASNNITINAAVTGGNGGAGQSTSSLNGSAGYGGGGGAGLVFNAGGSVNVNAAVAGGAGGTGFTNSFYPPFIGYPGFPGYIGFPGPFFLPTFNNGGIGGAGGAGITGSNLAVTLQENGSIRGGVNGSSGLANAIEFGSGNNSLALKGGSITGNVALVSQFGVLDFVDSNATLGNAITGQGAVAKTGEGTLILTGSNTYSGSTTISAGTVQIGNGGSTGSIDGNVTNNAVLAFNRLNYLGYYGSISGIGAVNQIGSGTTVLAGQNTYTGGTTISAGTLQIGDGDGSDGSIVGNIANNATLAFFNYGATTFGGIISGTGAVNTSAGTVVLTGANTYSGGTSINGGTLQLGDGGTSGSITGDVVNNSVLAFNRSDVVTFGGSIAGNGAVNQIGSGTTILTGNNSYIGGTVLQNGILNVGSAGALGEQGQIQFTGGTLQYSAANQTDYSGRFSTDTGQRFSIDTNGQTVTFATGLGDGMRRDYSFGRLLMPESDSEFSWQPFNPIKQPIAVPNSLTKLGDGTLVLVAENTYTGGTTISGGTLQLGNGGTSGSIVGDVTNNATFAFNRSDDVTFGGVISGTGAVNQIGTGTTTLTAANTYLGLTSVTAGTLAIAAEGSIVGGVNNSATFTNAGNVSGGLTNSGIVNANGGAINGAIVNNAGTFNVDGTVTSDSVFTNNSGALLAVSGVGNYTLGGLLTNAGTTSVANGGVLIATAGGITNTATGTITNNGTIRDDLNNAGTVTNNMAYVGNVATNTGTIANTSTGTWTGDVASNAGTLSNANVWTGSINNSGRFSNATGATVSGLVTNSGTTINDGAFNGGLTNSAGVTINNGSITGPVTISGGALTGNGSLANLNVSTGIFAPGNGTAGSSMTVNGNLALASGVQYVVQVNPSTASFANVTGSANLGGATVSATFANGSYVSRQYTILTAAGGRSGTFGGLANTNLPTNFASSLSYDANNAYLNLALTFTPPPSAPAFAPLNQNQRNVANALINSFNTNGGIPMAFASLSAAGLTQVSGEAATGTQQTTFDAMGQFMGVMTDPAIAGRGDGIAASNNALGYAAQASGNPQDAMAAIYRKSPALLSPVPSQRWSVWSAGFGGSQTTDGNAALGPGTSTSRVYGGALGLDYRVSPYTIAGITLAGGGTNFAVANSGSGRSDLFQAGAFVRHNIGASYLTAALAYGWQDVTTDRNVGANRLNARFNTDTFAGRIEAGHRFVDPTFGMGITPYAAGQFTTVSLPGYRETAGIANTFALNYAAKDVTATRSEFGVRTDKSYAMQDGIFTLRGRAAWAHNFNPDRSINATFQSLPGASFVVNGASQAADAALVTASAEMKYLSGWALAATFEGEFSNVTRSYAGKGVVRYGW